MLASESKNNRVWVIRTFGYELSFLLGVGGRKCFVLDLGAVIVTVLVLGVLYGFNRVSSLFGIQQLFFAGGFQVYLVYRVKGIRVI